ncbi:hypothetical protein ABZX40_03375 [Streptomyces sp. NPDC004610]|uniref:hypothetical protein n=1 Tax=unclassified Streptomyces TaxID=2593676 RepID=UPI0033A0DB58
MNPELVVQRLFEELEAEHFDFTITLADREDERRWLQLRGNMINLAHPYTDPPEAILPSGLFGTVSWDVVSWEPGSYATIDWGTDSTGRDERLALTELLTRLLEHHLALPADSERWVVEEG